MKYEAWNFYLHNGFLPRFRRCGSNCVNIVIQFHRDEDNWFIHPFYIAKPLSKTLTGKTPESLMFQIDLVLLDANHEVEQPFIFPDVDL